MYRKSVENGVPACTIAETQGILIQSVHHVTKTSYSTWSDVELCIREENDPPASLALPTLPPTPAGPPSLPQPHRRARWDKTAAAELHNGLVLAELARDCEDSEWDDTTRWNETGVTETDILETDLDETTGQNETDLGETDIGETDYNNETDLGETDYNNETDLGETDYNNETDLGGETDYNETDLGGETDTNEGNATKENGSESKTKTEDETELTGSTQTKTKPSESTKRGSKQRTTMNRQGDTVRLSHGEIELERPVKQKVKRTASSRSRRVGYGDSEKEVTAKDITQSQNEAELTGHLREKERALRELSVMRSRLANLRKIIHGKNEEIKLLKARLKEEVMGEATAMREKTVRFGQQTASSAELAHLRRQVASLRQEKERLREELSRKVVAEKERKVEVMRTRQQQERRMRQAQREAQREGVRETKHVSILQKAIEAKEKELRSRQQVIHKLECEKLYLGEEILRITGVEEGFWSDQTLTRPQLSERERCLVRRNSSLNTQLSRLQIHLKSLSSENDTLKNKMEIEVEAPLHVRERSRKKEREVQLLKKKNSELANITRKLEEKVKSLEKKTKESPATERRNLLAARQREKDALYERQLQERDKEIQRLKHRMKELVRKLTGKNGEITRAQSTLELEQIIRTVTKERLQLERHLAAASEGLSRGGAGEGDAERLASLEETNSTLRQQLEDLEILTRQHSTLQRHVQEKDLECVTLKEKLKLKNELCQDLVSGTVTKRGWKSD